MAEPTETDRFLPAVQEYLDSFAAGVWDEASMLQTILPRDRIHTARDGEDLVIGHAGVDGIEFCLRRGRAGVYAWYGIDRRHVALAPDIRSLLSGWQDGSITV